MNHTMAWRALLGQFQHCNMNIALLISFHDMAAVLRLKSHVIDSICAGGQNGGVIALILVVEEAVFNEMISKEFQILRNRTVVEHVSSLITCDTRATDVKGVISPNRMNHRGHTAGSGCFQAQECQH